MPIFFPTSSSSGQANVFNLNPSVNMTKWRRALARVRSGTSNARIVHLGNSVVLGVGSGTTNAALTSGDVITHNISAAMRDIFNGQGVNAHCNSFTGTGFNASTQGWAGRFASDPRLSTGSWVASGSQNIGTAGGFALGGAFFQTAVSATCTLTPSSNTDTCELYAPQQTGFTLGTVQIDANGGTPVTINNGGGTATYAVAKATVTTTLGANVYNVTRNAGVCAFFAMSAYDSSKKWVDIMNGGWSGAIWGTANTNPPGMAQVGATLSLPGLSPDLTIIQGSINDWVHATSIAAFTAGVQAMITAALLTGDVILSTDNPSITSQATTAAQLSYINVMYGLAASNNIPLVDFWLSFNSYTATLALGLNFVDNAATNFHLNNTGYNDEASLLCNVLLSV